MSDYSSLNNFAPLYVYFTDQNYNSLLVERSIYHPDLLNNYKYPSYAMTGNYTLAGDERGGNWRSSKHIRVWHNTKYQPQTNY